VFPDIGERFAYAPAEEKVMSSSAEWHRGVKSTHVSTALHYEPALEVPVAAGPLLLWSETSEAFASWLWCDQGPSVPASRQQPTDDCFDGRLGGLLVICIPANELGQ